MKKDLLKWMTILMVAIVSISFVSCSNDDDNNKQDDEETTTSIIGTWRDSWDDGPYGYTAYSFFDDGTGLYFDKGNSAECFTYTYNVPSNNVSIEYNEYDKEQMTVSKVTSNTLVMDGEEYQKVELTYDMLILGEWDLRIDANNNYEKRTRVVFSADWDLWGIGTYEAKDYNNVNDARYESHSGTWSISGKELLIKGSSQIAGKYIIERLVVNECRFVRATNPDEKPYLLGRWY